MLNTILKITYCTLHLFVICYTCHKFYVFLSSGIYPNVSIQTSERLYPRLILDFVLALTFFVQHSILKTKVLESILPQAYRCFSRSLYALMSCGSLIALIHFWQHVDLYLWKLDISSRMFTVIHNISWYLVFFTFIISDLPDLLGLKQIHYHYKNLGNPEYKQSLHLERFLSHMKHGSFLAFNIIFWIRPHMTLDMLLLAFLFTSFMYFRWRPDSKDWEYQKKMWSQKKLSWRLDY